MEKMLASGDLSDVNFTVGRQFGQTKNFAAHKFVLATRSSVFRTMFYGSLPEQCQAALDIPDICPEGFANLLSFMYADTVKDLTRDNAFATICCADKYDLPQLVKCCTDLVLSQLNPENCLATLEEAVQWHTDGIAQKCLEMVDAKSYRVLHSEHFCSLSQHVLRIILQRSTLMVEENVVFLAVESWAIAACARNDMDPSGANQRQMLGDEFFLVRFPLLSPSQFSDATKGGLLTEAEISSLIMYQNATVKPSLPFPVERRTGPQPLDPLTLRYEEDVFVHIDGMKWWRPARISKFNADQVSFVWCNTGRQGTVTPDKVVRAADILQHGQPLRARTSYVYNYKDVTYDGMEGSQHRVSCNGEDVVVLFQNLMLWNHQVVSWKLNNGRI
ncbi:BTB/POZ domain-containing protein 6-B-like [Paramacrobiotus metropolitanus]|uniref:BTB/POZ domain-containing protein 6-B-like n=1 Tax=Paramacrobiotus metropolitanus TaxID=2943436 RepID=UPI0024460BF6|nr:BTB/POZ domain-containing protein 6-B-like [Paramacrobiotus metropolitanus]XP_055332516.1 BTB/POZ domain-containing protein 6-B-like [Paramacrobiotus metropolitanus]